MMLVRLHLKETPLIAAARLPGGHEENGPVGSGIRASALPVPCIDAIAGKNHIMPVEAHRIRDCLISWFHPIRQRDPVSLPS